jgi:hypothetical protein
MLTVSVMQPDPQASASLGLVMRQSLPQPPELLERLLGTNGALQSLHLLFGVAIRRQPVRFPRSEYPLSGQLLRPRPAFSPLLESHLTSCAVQGP